MRRQYVLGALVLSLVLVGSALYQLKTSAATPIEGAAVRLYGDLDGNGTYESLFDSDVSDANGSYAVSAGTYAGRSRARIMMPPGFGGPGPGANSGSLVHSSGPVADASVEMWEDTDGDGTVDTLRDTTTTTAGGSYALSPPVFGGGRAEVIVDSPPTFGGGFSGTLFQP